MTRNINKFKICLFFLSKVIHCHNCYEILKWIMKSQYYHCAIIFLFQLTVNSIASQNGKLKIYFFMYLIFVVCYWQNKNRSCSIDFWLIKNIFFIDDDHVDLSLAKQKQKSISNMNNSTHLRMVGFFLLVGYQTVLELYWYCMDVV